MTFSAIASHIGQSVSPVSRETGTNERRESYRAWRAHESAFRQARRSELRESASARLARKVSHGLKRRWSPVEISQRLRLDFADDTGESQNHPQDPVRPGLGEQRRELTRCLQSGRAKRRRQKRVETRSQIPRITMIGERPAEVEDRAVASHGEGDLMIGKIAGSAVGTLVERSP